MKEAIEKAMKWMEEKVRQHGWKIAIIVAVYFGFKRIWVWTILPIFGIIMLKQVALIFGYAWVDKLSVASVICSWVFVFSCLKIVGKTLFEDTKHAAKKQKV